MAVYTTRADIDNIYGVTNINIWADLDNDENQTAIDARVELYIEDVSRYIDDLFRDHIVDLPLEIPVPRTINRLCALQVGIRLYSPRKLEDENPVESHEKEFSRDVRRILAGQLILDVAITKNYPAAE